MAFSLSVLSIMLDLQMAIHAKSAILLKDNVKQMKPGEIISKFLRKSTQFLTRATFTLKCDMIFTYPCLQLHS